MNCFNLLAGTMGRSVKRFNIFGHRSSRQRVTTCFFSVDRRQRISAEHNNIKLDNTIDDASSKKAKNHIQTERETRESLEPVLKAQDDATHALDKENWIQVYKFKFIVAARTAVRLKVYHAALCGIALPCLLLSNHYGVKLDSNTSMLIFGLNFYIFLTTLFIGIIGQRLVGILYINDKKDKIRIARLSFFGHRLDTMHDLSDVMFFSDYGERNGSPFVHLRRYSQPKDQLVMFTSFGITNSELFAEIFGEIPKPPPSRISK